MTRHDDEDRELTLAEEGEYAALWAQLLPQDLAGQPLPDDVALRLDAVLTDLQADRGTGPGHAAHPGQVTDMGARRRRRRGQWLLAAAAVVAGGFALGPVLTGAGGDAGESATTADVGDASGAGDLATGLPALRSDRLAGDVAALVDSDVPPDGAGPRGTRSRATEDHSFASPGTEEEATRELKSDSAADREDATFKDKADQDPDPDPDPDLAAEVDPLARDAARCRAPESGTWWVVRYDGRRAVLVVEQGSTPREAEVRACRSGRTWASVTLPD